jgi:hypothetical protein
VFAVAGEVERLLREYRQNQDMVRGIGTHFYQIIYPVQLRHHEKMGISTREVGGPKVSLAYYSKLLLSNTRSVVLTAVKIPVLMFWVVTPYELVGRYERFGGTYCLHLQQL